MWAVYGQTCFPRYLTGGEIGNKRMGITARKRRSVKRISTVIYRFNVVFVDGDLSKTSSRIIYISQNELMFFPIIQMYVTCRKCAFSQRKSWPNLILIKFYIIMMYCTIIKRFYVNLKIVLKLCFFWSLDSDWFYSPTALQFSPEKHIILVFKKSHYVI